MDFIVSRDTEGGYPFRAALRIPQACSPAHCPLTITLANLGDSAAEFTAVGDILDCHFILKDQNQHRPTLQDGENPFWPAIESPSPKGGHRYACVTLAPGERAAWSFDLALYFKLSPGPWTLDLAVVPEVSNSQKYYVEFTPEDPRGDSMPRGYVPIRILGFAFIIGA